MPPLRGSSITDIPHSVVALWTSDRPVAETPLLDNTQHSQETFMPPAGFEPAIPPSERPQTPRLLDRAANGLGS